MDELRVEIGVKESFKTKLVRSRLKWAGHVERMGDGKLAKESDAKKGEGKGGEEHRECDGKIGKRMEIAAKDRRSWRLLIENIVIQK